MVAKRKKETIWTLELSVGARSAEEALENVKEALSTYSARELEQNLFLRDERIGVDEINDINMGIASPR